ncbi:MAG: RidA family protein [Planctomycetota bacterium]
MKRLSICLLLLTFAACSSPRKVTPASNPDLPFSSAVQVGDTLYVAGHLGLDPLTGNAPADPAIEAEAVLDAFQATIEKAGFAMKDLVHVRVFCSDVALYGVFNEAYRKRFSGDFPARAFIGSGTLLREARFEVEGIAVAE